MRLKQVKEDIEEFNESEWMSCPMCGFNSCQMYSKGKNKGLFRCFECNIRFTRSKLYVGVR